MLGLVLLEMDTVCVRFSFIRNGLCVLGLVFTRARKRAG